VRAGTSVFRYFAPSAAVYDGGSLVGLGRRGKTSRKETGV
jgi:hypothetical protein